MYRLISQTAAARYLGKANASNLIRDLGDVLPPFDVMTLGSKDAPEDGVGYWFESTFAEWITDRGESYDRRKSLR